MIMLNLFIGVIMNGMQEAQAEAEKNLQKLQQTSERSIHQEFADLRARIREVDEHISRIEHHASGTIPPNELHA
jgi:hypothetical protein